MGTPQRKRLRRPEAAARAGISARTLERLHARGEGPPFVRISPGVLYYDADDLERWLRSRRVEPSQRGGGVPDVFASSARARSEAALDVFEDALARALADKVLRELREQQPVDPPTESPRERSSVARPSG